MSDEPTNPGPRRARLRTPARGVPESEPPFDTVKEAIRELWHLRKVPNHMMDLSARITLLEAAPEATADDLRELREQLIELVGRDGDGGRLAAIERLEDRVSRIEVNLAKAIMWALGMLLAALSSLIAPRFIG